MSRTFPQDIRTEPDAFRQGERLLRPGAWRPYGDFEDRASLRTWLYKIATNACLRALESRGRRPLPSGLGAPGTDPDGPLATGQGEVPWLEPIPDALMRADPANPASVVASRASLLLRGSPTPPHAPDHPESTPAPFRRPTP